MHKVQQMQNLNNQHLKLLMHMLGFTIKWVICSFHNAVAFFHIVTARKHLAMCKTPASASFLCSSASQQNVGTGIFNDAKGVKLVVFDGLWLPVKLSSVLLKAAATFNF